MPDIEDLSDLQFLTEWHSFFGARRAASMIGWTVIFAAQMREQENTDALAQRLAAAGWCRASVYNAAEDFKRFRVHVEQLPQLRTDRDLSMKEFALKSVRLAGLL